MCITLAFIGMVSLFVVAIVFLGSAMMTTTFKLYLVATMGICKSKNKLNGKTVIITGGDSGIGKETAIDLAKRGARVILACRNMKKAEKAKHEIIRKSGKDEVVVRELDLASMKSVRNFAKEIIETESQLDILINNAGVFGPEKKLTEDGLDYQMACNYFGHFLLTNLLLGLMIKTGTARIIDVCSAFHVFTRHLPLDDLNFECSTGELLLPVRIYCASTLCKLLFSNELARRLKESQHGKSVTVNSLHPGVVFSDIGRYSLWSRLFMWLFAIFLKTPRQGAQTSIYLAVADEVANVTGKYFSDCKVAGTSKLAKDTKLAKDLWEVSEKLVNLIPEERSLCYA